MDAISEIYDEMDTWQQNLNMANKMIDNHLCMIKMTNELGVQAA
jgi:hypothetical protein